MSRPRAPAPPPDLEAEIIIVGGQPLAVLSHPVTSAEAPRLTVAECEIAVLARSGLSDRAIANLRGVTRSTITKQLAEVFRKLGVGSRRELMLVTLPTNRAK